MRKIMTRLLILMTLSTMATSCSVGGDPNANAASATPAMTPATATSITPQVAQMPTDTSGVVPLDATPDASMTPSDAASDSAAGGRNWLAFGAGTVVVNKSSESPSSDAAARMLIDESGFEWETAEGETANQSVTLELPARTTFKSFVFDTAQPTRDDGRTPKDVTIEVSDTSATSGFQTILEATLKDSTNKNGVDGQSFSASKAVPARFLRFTARNNFGSPVSILTKELSGYGDQEPRQPIASVSGTYRMDSINELHLKQDGNAIIGCYKQDEGIIEGTIDGRTMTLVASGKGERAKGAKASFVAINVVDGGKTLLSTWWDWSATPKKKSYDRFYTGKKIADAIGNCAHMADLDGPKDVVRESLEKDLQDSGKAILYGINFDFNSDVIRPESKSTLDKVSAILKDKPDWKFSVEGHTDNIGGAAFNQTLSEKRAASVVKYLTAGGIDASRLTAKGYGFSKPIAPNDSEAERAQNRRVELVKQ